jgi:hypothetical protein
MVTGPSPLPNPKPKTQNPNSVTQVSSSCCSIFSPLVTTLRIGASQFALWEFSPSRKSTLNNHIWKSNANIRHCTEWLLACKVTGSLPPSKPKTLEIPNPKLLTLHLQFPLPLVHSSSYSINPDPGLHSLHLGEFFTAKLPLCLNLER